MKKSLLRLLRNQGYLVHGEKFFNRHYRLRSDFDPLTQLFYKQLHKDFFFVQIGANDGVSFDPIYSLVTTENVHGIALEPLPDIFEQLQKNYSGYPNVTLLRKAIHATEKEMVLYRVNPSVKEYPNWAKGIASFDKDHFKLGPIKESDLVEEKVPCLSFYELLEQYRIKQIDLLQIDTEGYDYDIIKMIDFNTIVPSIISFEHGVKVGIMKREKLFAIQELLLQHDYNILITENDAVAYHASTFKS